MGTMARAAWTRGHAWAAGRKLRRLLALGALGVSPGSLSGSTPTRPSTSPSSSTATNAYSADRSHVSSHSFSRPRSSRDSRSRSRSRPGRFSRARSSRSRRIRPGTSPPSLSAGTRASCPASCPSSSPHGRLAGRWPRTSRRPARNAASRLPRAERPPRAERRRREILLDRRVHSCVLALLKNRTA